MAKPFVSFVVPCFNAAHFLPACIGSLLAQTYDHFEILIRDNCSEDNTADVVRGFGDSRIIYVRNSSNIGHTRNFNDGIAASHGKYVMLIAADDFLVDNSCLARYVDVMESYHRLGYVFCRAIDVGGAVLEFTNCGTTDQIWRGRVFLKRLIKHNCIVMSSLMVRRECFDQHGPFSLDLPYANDWYLWSACAMTWDVAYISRSMVCFRIHGDSLSASYQQACDPICVLDELRVLGRVAELAQGARERSLSRTCKSAMAMRAARALYASQTSGMTASFRERDLAEQLSRCLDDDKERSGLLASVYSSLGDHYFWNKQYKDAAMFYRKATDLRPFWWRNATKSTLLNTGTAGIAARHLVRAIPWRP